MILESEPAPLASPRAKPCRKGSALWSTVAVFAKSRDARFQDVVELAQALSLYAGPEGLAFCGARARRAFASAGSLGSNSLVDSSDALPGAPSDPAAPDSPGRASTGRLWASQSTVTTPRRRRRSLGGSAAALSVVVVAVGLGTLLSRYVGGDSLACRCGPGGAARVGR